VHSREAVVREVAGGHQEVVVVDGRLLGYRNNAVPDREELMAAGVGQSPG
jgi:hypothetical protein